MFIDVNDLLRDADKIEEIEKASAKLVTQAIYEFRGTAAKIFRQEPDLPQDIAEDVTREALDRLGVSRMDTRLFGKIDYKRARYIFHRDYAVRQALFVDSKAEMEHGTSTLQTAQTSMTIRHVRAGRPVKVSGTMPLLRRTEKGECVTTTILVKYEYTDSPRVRLLEITVAAVPSGALQSRYNPSVTDTIWRAGRNAPSRGERFRVRLVFDWLKQRARWRVQTIPMNPMRPATPGSFPWDE